MKAAAALEDARRRVRGLMNRMGESSVANIVGEIVGMQAREREQWEVDAARRELADEALVDAPAAAPEQYAAALAAFVAGVSGGARPAARFVRATLREIARRRLAPLNACMRPTSAPCSRACTRAGSTRVASCTGS